jgi:hypothetical protein
MNKRFLGAWRLASFESRAADGTISQPMGKDADGVIMWDASGAFSAQLGPRERPEGQGYLAYWGTFEADDADEGEIVHHVLGASLPRLTEDQVRKFRFLSADRLTLQPPAAATGAQATLTWERIPAKMS